MSLSPFPSQFEQFLDVVLFFQLEFGLSLMNAGQRVLDPSDVNVIVHLSLLVGFLS
jgi:hypothetical protein